MTLGSILSLRGQSRWAMDCHCYFAHHHQCHYQYPLDPDLAISQSREAAV